VDRARSRRTAIRRAAPAVNVRRFAALVPVAAIFVVGAGAARWLLGRAPASIQIDRTQPLVVATAWGSFGGVAFAILAATALLAALFLVLAVRRLSADGEPGDVWTVVLVAALALAGAFAWPFVFSSDTYAYAAYGAMAGQGLDPYAPLPPTAQGAFYDAALWQWRGPYPVCVYGPIFVAGASAVVHAIGSNGVAATLWTFRGLAGLAFLGSVALLGSALTSFPVSVRFGALCAYGLNPAILWTVAEGHNDAFLLLLVMAAGALAVTRPRAGAFVLGLGPLVKAPGAALALGAVVETYLLGRPGRGPIVAAGLAGLTLATAVAFPPLRPALATIDAHGRYSPQISVQGLIGLAPALVLALAAAAYGIWKLAGRDRAGLAWLGIAVLISLPNWYPWYALWLVPWSLAAGDTAASRALWAATISSLARYLPDAVSLSPEAARLTAGAAVLPLIFAAADIRRAAPVPKKAPARP
jgi:hypothetical protein